MIKESRMSEDQSRALSFMHIQTVTGSSAKLYTTSQTTSGQYTATGTSCTDLEVTTQSIVRAAVEIRLPEI